MFIENSVSFLRNRRSDCDRASREAGKNRETPSLQTGHTRVMQPRLLFKGRGLHSRPTAATAPRAQLQPAPPRCCWLYPMSGSRGWAHWDLGGTG